MSDSISRSHWSAANSSNHLRKRANSTAERCETADSRSSTLMRIVYRLIAQRREDRGGKGSHRNFLHPSGVKITLSGAPGDNAKHYQERPQAYNSKSSIMSKT